MQRIRVRPRPRVRLSYPMMDDGARGWLINFCQANLYRISETFTRDDLEDFIQDGALLYCRVRLSYPFVRQPQHVMSLFMTSMKRFTIDLERKRKRREGLISFVSDVDDPVECPHTLHSVPDGLLVTQGTPWYIHAFLKLLCSPDGPVKLRRPYRVRMSGIREMTHDRLCRMIGADPSTTPTLPDAIEEYFGSV